MEIVVIDDGIYAGYFKINKLKYDLEINEDLKVTNRIKKSEFTKSHGTVCAAIITKYAPEATIISIKVLNPKTGVGGVKQLKTALLWCLDKNVPLINISLGTTQCTDFDDLRYVISQLYRSGCIIIAAYDNRNIYTMPASMECTIGVRCNPDIIESCRVIEGNFENYVEASGRHVIKSINEERYVSRNSNSFAAPYITALLHNFMERRSTTNISEIWEHLCNNSKELYHFPDFIDEAVVVDISKDEWINLFYFPVNCVYNYTNIDKIKNIKDNIYIVVLVDNTYPILTLLDKIQGMNNIKGIFFCFRPEISRIINNNLFHYIWQESFYLDKYIYIDDSEPIDIPLIYIYGERSLLIEILRELKKLFLREGYNIRIVGEFQRAYLYGFEYIDDEVNRVNIIHSVYKRFDCDIVICGIDSNVVSHDEEDISFYLGTEGRIENDDYIYVNITKNKDHTKIIFNRILREFN